MTTPPAQATDDDRRFARLGAFALFGGAGGVFLLWLLFFWAGGTSSLSGVDDVHGFLTRLSSFVPALLIILAHLAVGWQLFVYARTGVARP